MEISGRAVLVGGLAVNWSAPSLADQGGTEPSPWDGSVRGPLFPVVSGEEEGREALCGTRRVDGKEPWGLSSEDVCMDGQNGFSQRPPGCFFPPRDITKSFSCGFLNFFFCIYEELVLVLLLCKEKKIKLLLLDRLVFQRLVLSHW